MLRSDTFSVVSRLLTHIKAHNEKNSPISIVRTLAFLPVTFAVAAIVYILIGTEEPTWVGPSVDAVLFLSASLNFAGYIAALVYRSKPIFFASVVLSALFLVVFVGAVFSSFPGTGGRHGISFIGGVVFIGLTSGILILFQNQNGRYAGSIAVAAVLAMFVVPVGAYFYLSTPLYRAIQKMDLSQTCLFQASWHNDDFVSIQRVQAIEDLTLGIFIGEHSQRIVEVSETRARTWSFSGRKFVQSFSRSKFPETCAK